MTGWSQEAGCYVWSCEWGCSGFDCESQAEAEQEFWDHECSGKKSPV